MLKRIGLTFSGGVLGGLANSVFLWFLGSSHLTWYLRINISPDLTPEWIYTRIVWGGLWGFLFLLPVTKTSLFKQGLLFSLGPTLVQLFVVFPFKDHVGMWGFQLGLLTPVLVVVVNAVWGLTTALYLKLTK